MTKKQALKELKIVDTILLGLILVLPVSILILVGVLSSLFFNDYLKYLVLGSLSLLTLTLMLVSYYVSLVLEKMQRGTDK